MGSASTPVFWQVSTRADFLKGDVENLSIDSDGRLSLGPATTLVYDSAAPFLWTLVPGPDGAVFAGSGNEGKVFRIDATARPRSSSTRPSSRSTRSRRRRTAACTWPPRPTAGSTSVDAEGPATPFF